MGRPRRACCRQHLALAAIVAKAELAGRKHCIVENQHLKPKPDHQSHSDEQELTGRPSDHRADPLPITKHTGLAEAAAWRPAETFQRRWLSGQAPAVSATSRFSSRLPTFADRLRFAAKYDDGESGRYQQSRQVQFARDVPSWHGGAQVGVKTEHTKVADESNQQNDPERAEYHPNVGCNWRAGQSCGTRQTRDEEEQSR